MSEIKKGDLVMQVRATTCCGDASGVGSVFVVTWLGVATGQCNHCGDITAEDSASTVESEDATPLHLLKKIDPPSTGEYDRVPVRKTEPAEVL